MCDLIYDVISCCVWNCDAGKINVYDKIVIENKKKYGDNSIFYLNLHSKDGLGMEFTAC